MSGGTHAFWRDCPDCSCRVFERDVDLFTDSESEHCKACGSLVTISTDAESPVDVRVDEHGGDVVARLRAESTVLASVLEALEDPSRPEEPPVDAVRRLRAEVERPDAQRVPLPGEPLDVGLRADPHRPLDPEWVKREDGQMLARLDVIEIGAMRTRAETAERERDVLRELVRAAQHHIPRSWPQWPAWAKRAFDTLGSEFALSGSGDFEDIATDETEPRRPDPDDMHGACDGFGGSDF